MLVDHLFQYRISLWPKTAKKRGFCTCVTDGRLDQRTDGRTNGRTDRPSFRDARTHIKRMEPENKHMKKRFRRTRIQMRFENQTKTECQTNSFKQTQRDNAGDRKIQTLTDMNEKMDETR